jgi:hypothetical protein
VYEIYKAGEPPRWLPGTDVLGSLTGLRAAVVPHYDNAEGATHDTRFCYLGEPRLAAMEEQLPDDVGVLGVDEHTALWFDLAAGTARVLGRGGVTVRRRGRSVVVPAGETVPASRLDDLLRGREVGATAPVAAAPGPTPAEPEVAGSLREAADAASTAFSAALTARDASGLVAAVLGLEQAIQDWSTDMLVSDDAASARRTLRALIVRLGELATDGVRDPREAVAPYVDALLELRAAARVNRDYATSDLVRDKLTAAGVEVRDTPDGAQWSLAD